MKTLFLVRHAKSDWHAASACDFQRPLNDRGLKAAPLMGQRLQAKSMKPDAILASPATRAKQTAELMALEMDYPQEKIGWEQTIYGASCDDLLALIHAAPSHDQSLMLVGHNPTMTIMANQLAGDTLSNIPTCGVYVIEFDLDDWRAVNKGLGRCLFYETPR